MTPRSLITISAIFFSCNTGHVKTPDAGAVPTQDSPATGTITAVEPPRAIPADTTSSDYFIYLLENEKDLNDHWTKKLNALDDFLLPTYTPFHLSLVRNWIINDSVSVIIFNLGTGTDSDEYLLTVKNKKDIVSKVHIEDAADADVTENNKDYYYMEYQQVDNRKIKLFKHIILNYDTDKEKDSMMAVENWVIRDNGMAVKK
ncbi:hypothetical protein A3860_16490 [Niastella vici]|uniref:Lipoprotein n=1 Tax=Niastella vici TaxID=1703345 RepID=A0A1V9G439_9BACT|nr:hypothetical protein [Niastella vici]OQP65268.1 hypothetical protein A3860_16490 [Niastella vici]